MMPMVGEYPPIASKTFAEAMSRCSRALSSTSSVLRMVSGSLPSTRSCSPLRANMSGSVSVRPSSPSRPSRRATWLQLTTFWMVAVRSWAGGLATQPTIFNARRNAGTDDCSRVAPSEPPTTMMSAGPLSSEPRCPPSSTLPPRMAPSPMRRPATLRTSIAQRARGCREVSRIEPTSGPIPEADVHLHHQDAHVRVHRGLPAPWRADQSLRQSAIRDFSRIMACP